LAAVSLAFLLGCARKELIRPPKRAEIVEQVLGSLQEESRRLRTLKAFGTLTGSEGQRGYFANFVLLYRKPGQFRLDLTGPFGLAIMSMVSDGKTARAYYPETGELFEGEPSLFLPVDLGPGEIEKMVLGTIEPPSDLRRAIVFSKAGSYILESPEQAWEMEVDGTDMRVRRYRKEREGNSPLEVIMSQYRRVDGLIRPYRIEIQQPKERKKLRIDCSRQILNEGLREEVFELTVPERK